MRKKIIKMLTAMFFVSFLVSGSCLLSGEMIYFITFAISLAWILCFCKANNYI